MGFDDILMDIDRIWAEMEPFYANIPVRIKISSYSNKYDSKSVYSSISI